MTTTGHLKLSGSLLAIVAACFSPALAQTNSWTGGSSFYYTCVVGGFPATCTTTGNTSWNDGSNWAAGVPTASQDVNIGIATLQVWGGVPTARPVQHDDVDITAGTNAVAGRLYIGFSGGRADSGSFGAGHLSNAGTLTVSSGMVVGSTGYGDYGASAGSTTTIQNGDLLVGATGAGVLGNGGAINVQNGSLVVGSVASGNLLNTAGAAINVSGGSVVVGNGDFQNFGSVQIGTGDLVIGRQGASTFQNNAGSTLAVGGDLVVGETSDGTLTSAAPITVGGNTVIGQNAAVTGTVTLSSGAGLTTAGSMTIGESGAGTLTNAAGSTVDTTGLVVLGLNATGEGTVTNQGTMNNGSRLIVGESGYGYFETTGAGGTTNTTGNVSVGGNDTGTGIVIVSQGTMNNQGRLDLGREGEGYLVVDGGGEINNSIGVMATERDARAYAVVTGTGSLWDNRTSLTLARDEGTMGVLVINDGGTVRINGGNGTLTIADEAGSTGILNIGAMSPVGENYGVHPDVTGYLAGLPLSPTDIAARAPGTLDATFVQFGEGDGMVNFKHIGAPVDDYRFKAGFVGKGTVNHYDGFTVLDGDSSGFTGDATVQGGVLVVNNVLGGSVTVDPAGILRIGHEGGPLPGDGTKGDVLNDIVNNGLVQFNRSDRYVYDNVISGTGDVEQMGSGTTVLTGENTYTGTTFINNGTLQLGDGGTSGSIDSTGGVLIAAAGTLAFDRSDVKVFDRVIGGTGTIRQIGTGVTRLTADSSTFSGRTFVDAGTLSVNGILGGTMDVNGGGTLEGLGTVGDTTAHNGGTIAPGNSTDPNKTEIGTLTVDGDLVQEAGSIYHPEVKSTGESDLLHVIGTAAISNDAILDVSKIDANRYELEHRYTVLTADGGLTGDYKLAGDTWVSTFYRVEDRYDANNVYLDVTQYRLFPEAGRTVNQINAATAAQELKWQRDPVTGYPTNPLFRAIAYLQTDEEARYAFDQISGELHASTRGRLLEDSRFARDVTDDRLRAAFGGIGEPMKVLTYEPGIDVKDPTPRPVWVEADKADGVVLWTQAFGSWNRSDGDGNAADFDRTGGGLFVGADMPFRDNFRIGIVGGWNRMKYDVEARHSTASSDNYHLGLYGGAEWGRFALRLGAGYTWHDVSALRSVVFPGFAETLVSDYDAGTAQIYGDLGYQFKLGGIDLEPFAGLAYANLNQGGYSETGGAAALSGGDDSTDVFYGTLGLRVRRNFDFNCLRMSAHGKLAWRHAFEDVIASSSHAFAGSSAFTVYGVPFARDVALVEAGLDTALDEKLILGFVYTGEFGEGVETHGVRANLSWNF